MKGGRIGISGHGEDPIHAGGGRPGIFNLVLLPTHHSQRYSISAHCSKKSRQDSAINVQKHLETEGLQWSAGVASFRPE